MANKIFVVHLQTQTKRGSLGSLAQLVQSVCLTSRGSGVRLPQLPQRIKQLQKCSCFFRVRKSRKRGEADNPGDEIIQPNAPSSHVVADEITWEQYILKKCPCRQVERRFLKPNAPKSVFLRRLGSSMFRRIGHPGRCRADFAKLIAPKFFRPALSVFPVQQICNPAQM